MREVLRERNRRGEGGKLRADILAGATELLEETGSEEAVTLRAVARQVGISAPSIYSHFPDREAIVDAIVDGAFADFNAAISAAIDAAASPLARLRAGCAAYLRFAAERPNRYKFLFERQILAPRPGGRSQRPRSEPRASRRSSGGFRTAWTPGSPRAPTRSSTAWPSGSRCTATRRCMRSWAASRGPTPM